MKLYVLVHVYDHSPDGVTSGGIKLDAFTSKRDAVNEMYRQLDRIWGQMDQETYGTEYSESFGFASITHYSDTFDQRIYDHEWRVVTM